MQVAQALDLRLERWGGFGSLAESADEVFRRCSGALRYMVNILAV